MTNAHAITVRPLTTHDRSRWDELWAGYLDFYRETLPAAITQATWQRLMQGEIHGLAAVDGDRIAGIAHYLFHASTWAMSSYCYLEDLFVDPATRGKGVGRALIEAVYRAADEAGAARVYWCTEKTNTQAQALYSQLAVLTPFLQYRRK